MHEVEVKAAVSDKDDLITRLAERGCILGPSITQDDRVYVRNLGSLEIYLANEDFLRLRVENDERTFFAFKKHTTRTTDPNSAPLELEVEVGSRKTMERILFLMGYQEAMWIKKVRQKGTYEGWEVCVDEVEGLGTFIELEELMDAPDTAADIQGRMEQFLDELGVSGTSNRRDRYDLLLLQQKYSSE
jgi:adenylate cyclase class 2